jgi:hypothetical protein
MTTGQRLIKAASTQYFPSETKLDHPAATCTTDCGFCNVFGSCSITPWRDGDVMHFRFNVQVHVV